MLELDETVRTKLISIIDSLLDLYSEKDACEEINALMRQRIQKRVERFAQANLKADLYKDIQKYITAGYHLAESEDFLENNEDALVHLAESLTDQIVDFVDKTAPSPKRRRHRKVAE